MYVKAVGVLLILLSCAAMGGLAARKAAKRAEYLEQLLLMTVLLKGEISYGEASLPEACRHISQRLEWPVGEFLGTLARELEMGEQRSFQEAFEQCAERILIPEEFAKEDLRPLLRLGAHMGYLDQRTQLRQLEVYEEEVKHTLGEVRDTLPKERRICWALGIFAGLFLAVFLW